MFSLLRENKERRPPPVDGGRRDGVLQAMLEVRRGQRVVCLADAGRERDQNVAPRSMPGGRERGHIWEDVPFVQAQGRG